MEACRVGRRGAVAHDEIYVDNHRVRDTRSPLSSTRQRAGQKHFYGRAHRRGMCGCDLHIPTSESAAVDITVHRTQTRWRLATSTLSSPGYGRIHRLLTKVGSPSDPAIPQGRQFAPGSVAHFTASPFAVNIYCMCWNNLGATHGAAQMGSPPAQPPPQHSRPLPVVPVLEQLALPQPLVL